MSVIERTRAGGGGSGEEGPPGPEGPRGEFRFREAWKAATEYKKGDAVTVGGSTYACIKAMTAGEDVTPPNATFWALIAENGAAGAAGPAGEKGENGEAGAAGSPKTAKEPPLEIVGSEITVKSEGITNALIAPGVLETKIKEEEGEAGQYVTRVRKQKVTGEKTFEARIVGTEGELLIKNKPAENALSGGANGVPPLQFEANTLLGQYPAGGDTSITTTGAGGRGAEFKLKSGNGGEARAAKTKSTGGLGGGFTLESGVGGSTNIPGVTTGANVGGEGGGFNLFGQEGGAAGSGTTNKGGRGGTFELRSGKGGAAVGTTGTGAAGAGGTLGIEAGAGGESQPTGGVGGGNGGEARMVGR